MMNGYYITKDKSKLQVMSIKNLMKQTYWAPDRAAEVIVKEIENSVCYGLFDNLDNQVGFARVITDYATTFYVCDVIIDEEHRGKSLGKAMVEYITGEEDYKNLYGILQTEDAHELYKRYGFEKDSKMFMYRQCK